MAEKHDLIVIGAGPGGYVAAIRAAQLGMNVACIDKHKALGGTCLRVGCIPSKALLESSERYIETRDHLGDHGISASDVQIDIKKLIKRKEKIVKTLTGGIGSLFKKNKVKNYTGTATIKAPGKVTVDGDDSVELEADHILIATGSVSAPLKGVEADGKIIGDSTMALDFTEAPEHLVVIGAGYIGLELGSVWTRLGSKVTVLEYLDRILPGLDAEVAAAAQKTLKKQGLEFHLGTAVTGATVKDGKAVVTRESGDPITADRVLLAVGRRPMTEGLGLDAIGLENTKRGYIEVDSHYETEIDGIYAIGDVIDTPMLAHVAEEEGIACVERIAGMAGHVNYDAIPAVVYTSPEISMVGKTEEELKEAGTPYKVGSFPFMANGRARTLAQTDGFVKILAHEKTDRILGVHILHARAGDLIAEAAAVMEYGASSEDLARTCHAHPTLSEAVKEAALAVGSGAIHI